MQTKTMHFSKPMALRTKKMNLSKPMALRTSRPRLPIVVKADASSSGEKFIGLRRHLKEAGMTDAEADVVTSQFAPVFVLADLTEKVLNRLESIEGRIKAFEENVDGRFDTLTKEIVVKLENLEKNMEGKIEDLEDKMEGKIKDLEKTIESKIGGKLTTFSYKILAGAAVLSVAGTTGSWVPALIKMLKF